MPACATTPRGRLRFTPSPSPRSAASSRSLRLRTSGLTSGESGGPSSLNAREDGSRDGLVARLPRLPRRLARRVLRGGLRARARGRARGARGGGGGFPTGRARRSFVRVALPHDDARRAALAPHASPRALLEDHQRFCGARAVLAEALALLPTGLLEHAKADVRGVDAPRGRAMPPRGSRNRPCAPRRGGGARLLRRCRAGAARGLVVRAPVRGAYHPARRPPRGRGVELARRRRRPIVGHRRARRELSAGSPGRREPPSRAHSGLFGAFRDRRRSRDVSVRA